MMETRKFVVKVADIPFGIECRCNAMLIMSKAYLAPSESPMFWISATDEEIVQEQEAAVEPVTADYAEVAILLKKLLEQILSLNAFYFHSAFIDYEGVGYAFAAKSGVGKSTHIKLWRTVFGEKVRIINGDKPIVRLIDGKFYAYGTPWCGKENYSINDRCELNKICFIERADTNHIVQIDPKDALVRMMPQLMMFSNGKRNLYMLEMIEQLLKYTEFFVLGCNISEDAARIAYNGMNQKKGI